MPVSYITSNTNALPRKRFFHYIDRAANAIQIKIAIGDTINSTALLRILVPVQLTKDKKSFEIEVGKQVIVTRDKVKY